MTQRKLTQHAILKRKNWRGMRRLAGSALLVAVAVLSGTAALACGDKLLAVGRGAAVPTCLCGASSQPGDLLRRHPEWRDSRQHQTADHAEAGRAQACNSCRAASQLDQALKSGKVDVVLVDFADLAGITRQLQSAPSKPVILPVLFKPSKAELAAAQKEYKFALKAAADDFEYLTAIDEAMKLRLKTGAKS